MKILVLGPDEGWHANQLRAAASAEGDWIEFAAYESLHALIDTRAHRNQASSSVGPLESFDAILTRTMPSGTLEQITFRLSVLHALQANGMRIVNPPRALELAIDKFAATSLIERAGFAVPKTSVCQSRAEAMKAFAQFDGPVVVKPLFGGEGRGVMLVTNKDLAWTTFSTLEQLGAVIYQQQYIGPGIKGGGTDVRLFVIGQRVWAIARSNPRDWRSNVSLGGVSQAIEVPPRYRSIALSVCEAFGLEIAGVDLIVDASATPHVLEVNGVPGWKGAQNVIGENLAAHMIHNLHH